VETHSALNNAVRKLRRTSTPKMRTMVCDPLSKKQNRSHHDMPLTCKQKYRAPEGCIALQHLCEDIEECPM
jgi:hypothetical protein